MSFRAFQAQTMVRATLHRDNNSNFNHRLLCRPPTPPTAVGAYPRLLSSCPLRAKYGYLPVSPVKGMTMMQPSYDASGDESGDELEADEKFNLDYDEYDDHAIYIHKDMPGVRKEDVKVYVEGYTQTLWVKGIRKLDCDEDSPKNYISAVSLIPIHEYKVAEIKAELKNGVLKVTVPRVTIEERNDVFHVNIN